MKNPSTPSRLTRRSFVKTSAVSLAGISIVPRHVLGGVGFTPPSDKLAIACIGVGSQGQRVMMDFLQQDGVQIVSVCDVNSGSGDYLEWGPGELRGKVREILGDNSWGPSEGTWCGLGPAQDIVQRYYAKKLGQPNYKATAYADYRDLLEQEKNIDGVVVCPPDHQHAIISIAALKHGKHVFSQKPMAHTVEEAKHMADVARETGLATQVATGNSASEATRLLTEWIADGAIGPVREVYNWSSRPFWPQALETPKEADPVPSYLNWDLWLGPSPNRPFNRIYQPFVWRGWYDFGSSSIGDMGCYSFDTIFRVLNLDAPERIEASSTPVFPDSYPLASVFHFHFPARGEMPPVVLHWSDAGIKPEKPDELGDAELPDEGLLFVGDKGKILSEFEGGEPHLIPESADKAYQRPPKTLPRSIGHYEEWIAAAKGEPVTPAANYMFAQSVTETILLANVAERVKKTLHWDAGRHALTGPAAAEASSLLSLPYRDGWTV